MRHKMECTWNTKAFNKSIDTNKKEHLSLLKTHSDQALRDGIDFASLPSSGRLLQILLV